MSIFLIWGLLIWLNMEAVKRLITPPKDIDANIMLITACIGFACNVTNFVALNWACKAPDDDEEIEDLQRSESINDNWTLANKSAYKGLTKMALSQQISSIYQPRQAHKCIHCDSTKKSGVFSREGSINEEE